MSDEDIKKALKYCFNGECEFCPYRGDKFFCFDKVKEEALDLINRQQAEIERYEKESNEQFDKMKLLDDRTKQRYAELFEEAKEFVRTEAIKEFAERLKAKVDPNWDNSVDVEDIDNLLAEMVGGENA